MMTYTPANTVPFLVRDEVPWMPPTTAAPSYGGEKVLYLPTTTSRSSMLGPGEARAALDQPQLTTSAGT